MEMMRYLGAFAMAAPLLVAAGGPVVAQKPGGIMRIYHRDSPASMSLHEEATISVAVPMMGVFNNLAMFDLHVPQNSLQSIVPDLARQHWLLGSTRRHLHWTSARLAC
jgi:peptide/nickel transport system substrate-binding protein